MQGWRNTQEDAALHYLDIDPGISIFAVFDGHGSNEVAEFCRDYFIKVLRIQKDYSLGNYSSALYNSCMEIDQLIKSQFAAVKLPEYQKPESKSKKRLGSQA